MIQISKVQGNINSEYKMGIERDTGGVQKSDDEEHHLINQQRKVL